MIAKTNKELYGLGAREVKKGTIVNILNYEYSEDPCFVYLCEELKTLEPFVIPKRFLTIGLFYC